MPEYLRHPNGRGKLFDDAEANRATYIDRASSASGSAKLRDCTLLESHVKDTAQVYGGIYHRTAIQGHTVCAGKLETYNSTLDCSEVSGKPSIMACRLLGVTEVCDCPLLVGITAQDAVIYGSPKLIGNFTVTGRVHEGTWRRAPKHVKLQWCELTECVDGKLLLDCRCRPIGYWLRHGAKLARRWDWSEDMIAVTLETIEREFPQSPTFLYDPTKIESYRACAIKL